VRLRALVERIAGRRRAHVPRAGRRGILGLAWPEPPIRAKTDPRAPDPSSEPVRFGRLEVLPGKGFARVVPDDEQPSKRD
jgi:hypothetical protein